MYTPESVSNIVLLAKTIFDCHEYERCAFILEKAAASDPHALFLRLYAKYISGEKKKEEEQEGVLGPNNLSLINKEIPLIMSELDDYAGNVNDDPFLLYIYGVALRHQKATEVAIKKLVASLEIFPYNWSAWQELLSCIPTLDKFHALKKSTPLLQTSSTMAKLFEINAKQEFFQHDAGALDTIEELQTKSLPNFLFLNIQKALIHYHGLNYEEAEDQFDHVILKDPYRIDGMDVYSNILYVTEKNAKLAFLAQLSTKVDKFRPETCCIVANYYSLKGEHEKAILYYQRALILDRSCLSAWTLMGHEFVELKNTHAAIESYRRAVDASNKDFRAWYGLGQAYEVLDMHYYSLYYYQRAVALKPMDVRMWLALGNSFENLDRIQDSIKCFKRALSVSDVDPAILYKIALLYEKEQDRTSTATYMKLCLAENNGDDKDVINHAGIWLAKYEYSLGNLLQAKAYAEKVTHGTATEIEEARGIVRQVKREVA